MTLLLGSSRPLWLVVPGLCGWDRYMFMMLIDGHMSWLLHTLIQCVTVQLATCVFLSCDWQFSNSGLCLEAVT